MPGYQCQAHHVTDWAKGGLTDIDGLTLACGKDNRLVTENDWRTRKRKDAAALRCKAAGSSGLGVPVGRFAPALPRRAGGLPPA